MDAPSKKTLTKKYRIFRYNLETNSFWPITLKTESLGFRTDFESEEEACEWLINYDGQRHNEGPFYIKPYYEVTLTAE